jgi:3-phenylpropionate/trans-cinnamate dioxygenase ferredoxin subunit
MSEWTDVAAAGNFPVGTWRTAEVDGVFVAVFRLEDGFYAIEDVCTHDGAELTGGPLEGDQVVCPRHGARFCVRTGAALTPPAYQPTRTFPVRVESGAVQVRV